MLIREAIHSRLSGAPEPDIQAARARLPSSLKTEPITVRNGLLKRLASSRAFTLGDRSGVLRAAQNRSGRAFRLDVRQRVIVKAMVSRHIGKGADRAAALAKHVAYLGRAGAGIEGTRPEFFDRHDAAIRAEAKTEGWAADRHHFRFIISPEHGDRIADLQGYVREVMARVCEDLGDPELCWVATCHHDTDQSHAHVLMRGRRTDGRDLVIPRDYIGYGFRARAQEVAQEKLGDLSRVDGERRIWKETQADRFTGFDRRLLSAMDGAGTVSDGIGAHDAWAALTRGRLRHLEGLGLATAIGRRYRLALDMEARLRRLQLSKDVVRTLNQRRLEGVKCARQLGGDPVTGRVVKAGFHDELGSEPYVMVKSPDGIEHYGRLGAGRIPPRVGKTITLQLHPNGVAHALLNPRQDLER